MKGEYLIIVIVGILIFLSSFNNQNNYFYQVLYFLSGCILVFLGIELENKSRKNKKF